MSETARAIGAAIRDARRAAGLTQADHAQLAELAERTLRDIERGTGTPGLGSVLRAASTVGLTLEVRAVPLEQRLSADSTR